jgi:hypothetical protein
MQPAVNSARRRASLGASGVALVLCACGDGRVASDADEEFARDASADVWRGDDVEEARDGAVMDACAPRCEGVECGDDGCGGLCGACPISLTCNAGRCGIADGGCAAGVVRACYTGRSETLGVGRCRGGAQTCGPLGAWDRGCAGDVRPVAEVCGNGVDDDCDGVVDESCERVETVVVSGRVSFERRRSNATRTGWGAVETVGAGGFAVYAMRGDTMVGAAVTSVVAGDEGKFSLRVPTALQSDDRIVVAAVMEGESGALDLALVSPGLSRGAWPAFRRSTVEPPRAWSWSWKTSEVAGGALGLHIAEREGSGVASVFDVARRTVVAARRAYRDEPTRTLMVWMAPGVEWSCGACFTGDAADVFGQWFEGQIAFPSGADETQWADAVVAHEVGHWVMNSYGVSPREVGAHAFNMALAPGLAWSEGYATWFGSVVRNDPVYLDRQRGTTFWLDIAARRLGRGSSEITPWTRPDPRAGLLQGLSETEVSAILWAIDPTGSRDALHRAFNSPRMMQRPFARGYISAINGSTPVLPDFLDALACAGTSAAVIDSATRGDYPYPSRAPDCRVGSRGMSSPLDVSLRLEGAPERAPDGSLRATLVARAVQHAWLPSPIRAAITLPATARIDGAASWRIDASGPETVSERRFSVRYLDGTTEPLSFTVSARDESMGAHGEARWRWGAAEPSLVPVDADGPSLVVRARDLGRSVSMRPRGATLIRGRGAAGGCSAR